jgi:hypothetical protein
VLGGDGVIQDGKDKRGLGNATQGDRARGETSKHGVRIEDLPRALELGQSLLAALHCHD